MQLMKIETKLLVHFKSDGVRKELLISLDGKFGFIRFIDADSKQVIGLTKYPNFKQAEDKFHSFL